MGFSLYVHALLCLWSAPLRTQKKSGTKLAPQKSSSATTRTHRRAAAASAVAKTGENVAVASVSATTCIFCHLSIARLGLIAQNWIFAIGHHPRIVVNGALGLIEVVITKTQIIMGHVITKARAIG